MRTFDHSKLVGMKARATVSSWGYPLLLFITLSHTWLVSVASAQSGTVPRVGAVQLRSARGGVGVSPGEVGIVTAFVINPTASTLTGIEAEVTTASQVKLVAMSSIGTSYVDRQRIAVPSIKPNDSVAVIVRIFAPKKPLLSDGALPVWMSLFRDGSPLTPAADLRLSNFGVRSVSGSGELVAAVTKTEEAIVQRAVSTGLRTPETQVTRAPAFVSDVDSNVPEARAPRPDDIAVIVGNRNYRRAPEVTYALNDARSMRVYVERALGFRPGNIIYLEDATLSDMKVLFGDVGDPNGRVADLVKPGRSEVWVFYSGHGAPDPSARKAFLMPVDADANRLGLTGLSVDMLYENLSKIGARHVTVVIDACFSGASGGGQMLITAASPIGIQVNDPSALFARSGSATIIAAAEGQQLANWHLSQEHGLLTYFLLKGLQGSADSNRDGAITVSEMKAWLTDRADGVPYQARRLHGRDQTPMIWGAGERVIRR